MADLTIVAAEVLPEATAAYVPLGVAGTTLAAGEWVYLDGVTHTYKLALAGGIAALAAGAGMAMNSAVAGQAVRVQRSGEVYVGGTIVVGQLYLVSTNAGKLRPVSDLGSGQWVSLAGVGLSGNVLSLAPWNTGVLRA